MTGDQEYLFPELDGPRNGSNRPYQNLFLPRLLAKAAIDNRLTGSAQDRAFEIIQKWAKLESSGKLQKKKETELQGEFLTEVFGEALGYTLFSEGKEQWNLAPQFPVNSSVPHRLRWVWVASRAGAVAPAYSCLADRVPHP